LKAILRAHHPSRALTLFAFFSSWTALLVAGCASPNITSSASPAGSPPPQNAQSISITISLPAFSLQAGQTQSLSATVQNDAQNKGVNWTLSGSACSGAACGVLSASSSTSGTAITYTAPMTVPGPPTVILTATSVTDPTKSASATITITALPPPVSVTVAPASQSVMTGQTQSFTATVQNDPQSKGVTWALSGTGCTGAACGTLSNSSSASGTPKVPSPRSSSRLRRLALACLRRAFPFKPSNRRFSRQLCRTIHRTKA
jgi:uncharacterized protein YjdB